MYGIPEQRELYGEKEKTLTLKEALLGGPGLDGYAWQADVYCIECGRDITRHVFADYRKEGIPDGIPYPEAEDTEVLPQPIFFGESDCAQHCGSCGAYLYGPQKEAEEESEEPEEGDITTEDYRRFYQYGKLVLDIGKAENWRSHVKAFMDRERFWPDVWFVSDHGNAHRLDV